MDNYYLYGLLGFVAIVLVGIGVVARRHRKKQRYLRSLQQQCRSLFDVTTDGIMILEGNDTIVYTNDAVSHFFEHNLTLPSRIKRKVFSFYIEDKPLNLKDFLHEHAQDGYQEFKLLSPIQIRTRRYGDMTANLYIGSLYLDEDDTPRTLVVLRDLQEVSREIVSRTRDPLTHLPNREKAYEDFQKLCSRQHLNDSSFAVMIVSLDNFLVAQSMMGHDKTDKTILAVTESLRELSHIYAFDIYHLTYTNFMLMQPTVGSREEVQQLATKIQQTLSALYGQRRSTIYLTASIGIAVHPESGKATELFDHAHKALLEAQRIGNNSIYLYQQTDTRHHVNEAQLQQDIQFAIERKELIIFYQPIVDASTHSIVGAEALLRWKHPEYGLISPLVFIPLMEQTGFIVEAGRFLIGEVIRQQATWKRFGFQEIFLSLNASMREFDVPGYTEFIIDQLKKHQVEGRLIKVEITESLAMTNAEKMIDTLMQLDRHGIPIALDDFGTGYTSFSYLTRMPADTLKIDKSFIDHILTETKQQQVVKAIIEVGHALGMKVVAEGIENLKTAKLLTEYGANYLQGYYFSKPIPVYELQGFMKKKASRPDTGTPDDLFLTTP